MEINNCGNMDYDKAVRLLESMPQFISKNPDYAYGIQRMKVMLDELNHPEKGIDLVQVAGTNGKGSVTAYLSSIFQAVGHKTGMFTSPHLTDIRERICFNGEMISKDDFARLFFKVYLLVKELKKRIKDFDLAYFEYTLAIALLYYEEVKANVIVCETGLGGSKDAVTALESPIVCVITSIGLDHTAVLGNTIKEISKEKAGIVRDDSVVVTLADCESYNVIKTECMNKKCTINPLYKKSVKTIKHTSSQIDFLIENDYYKNVTFKLKSPALYQVENAALALMAHISFVERKGGCISKNDIEKARSALALVKRKARMEKLADNIFVDGAHNPQGIERFLETAEVLSKDKNAILVFSAVSDKNFKKMADDIVSSAIFDEYIITEIGSTERALDKEKIAEIFRDKSGINEDKLHIFSTVEEAMNKALNLYREHKNNDTDSIVFITGSLYLAGEVEKLVELL